VIAAEVSELAILRVVAAITLPGAGIDGRDESVGIEPLKCSWLGHARNRMMVVQRNPRYNTGEFRAAALHNAVTTRGIGRAQNRERERRYAKTRSRNLPAVQRVAQRMIAPFMGN
jgi:hypothetical protein